MNDTTKDYLTFKKMITPTIIQILFWVLVAAVVIAGLIAMTQRGGFLSGLLMVILGPILVRVYMEIIMVMFKINEAVQTIAKKR